jgi:hypothetical protein
MGFAGKPQGMDGGEVEKYYRDGRIKEIAEYCESDVINTYRVWLRYELFRGKLSKQSYEASEANLHGNLSALPSLVCDAPQISHALSLKL